MLDILLVDDEKKMVHLLKSILTEEGYRVTGVFSGAAAIEQLRQVSFDMILTDLRMTPIDGMEVLTTARRLHPDCEVIMMTAYASAETAVEAMKAGACDYIIKPFKTDELLLLLKNISEKIALRQENRQLKKKLSQDSEFENIIHQSSAMRDVLEQVRQVAPTHTTVLLRGESGYRQGVDCTSDSSGKSASQ